MCTVSSDIWIVLSENRHSDVEPYPFSSEEAAVSAAGRIVRESAYRPEDIEWDAELTPAMRGGGWVCYVPYGPEGDSVRVVKRTLDDVT
jgi:hypothetical protein